MPWSTEKCSFPLFRKNDIPNGMKDETFMKRAINLALRGAGRVSPNPMVGCVIVKNGRIIGEGWHACCGGDHAEINAIKNARESIAGSTVYITLEPCTHYGRTPPCVDRLVKERPVRVVIGTEDPNPIVRGRGVEILKKNGISVTLGVRELECRRLIAPFAKHITTGLPFVTVKYAQSLDGRIATSSGHARWISSPLALKYAHELRREHDAILVGKGTVLADDPELTTRHVRGPNPLRVILDARLSLPLTARVFTTLEKAPTLVITSVQAPVEKKRVLEAQGIEVKEVGEKSPGYLNLEEILKFLGKRNMTSLLVEGGSEVITAFIAAKLVDRLIVVLCPCIIGEGLPAVGNLQTHTIDEAKRFVVEQVKKKGQDYIFTLTPEEV